MNDTVDFKEKLRRQKISETLKKRFRNGDFSSRIYPIGELHPMFGRKHIKETKLLMRKAKLGKKFEKANKWKGDNVGYRGLHIWVEQVLGTPHKCVSCGKLPKTRRHVQWANKSQEYKREITDWLSLCVSCHKKYDSGKLLIT